MLNFEDTTWFKRSLKFFILSLAITIISFVLTLIVNPSIDTFKNIARKVPDSVTQAQGLEKVWEYIVHNAAMVPFQMLLLAFIPIPFLYCLNYITTSALLGVICSIAIQIDLHKGISMIISTIPHHFLELFAMCIVVSSLFKLNQSIVRKITNFFRQDKKQNYSFKTACMSLMKSYLLIALPLYILAAFTETYVSNFIYEILQ